MSHGLKRALSNEKIVWWVCVYVCVCVGGDMININMIITTIIKNNTNTNNNNNNSS